MLQNCLLYMLYESITNIMEMQKSQASLSLSLSSIAAQITVGRWYPKRHFRGDFLVYNLKMLPPPPHTHTQSS